MRLLAVVNMQLMGMAKVMRAEHEAQNVVNM